jgi:hypothetical protein
MRQKPYIDIPNSSDSCWSGWSAIGQALLGHIQKLDKTRVVVTVECYPGTYTGLDMSALKASLQPDVVCRAEDLYREEGEIRQLGAQLFSPAPPPGTSFPVDLSAYFDETKLSSLHETIDSFTAGIILIHGVGAHRVWESDVLVYSDLSRWELLQRMRRQEVGNLGMDNRQTPFSQRLPWAYYLEWPMADAIKRQLIPTCDFFLETNNWQQPKLAVGEVIRSGLKLATRQPLTLAPFFDPSLWDQPVERAATNDLPATFPLDLEEDNLLFRIDGELVEFPALNVWYFQPDAFAGSFENDGSVPVLPLRMEHLDRRQLEWHEMVYYPSDAAFQSLFPALPTMNHTDHYLFLQTGPKAELLAGLKETGLTDTDTPLDNLPVPDKKVPRKLLSDLTPERLTSLSVPGGHIHSMGIDLEMIHLSTGPSLWRQLLQRKQQPGAAITQEQLSACIEKVPNDAMRIQSFQTPNPDSSRVNWQYWEVESGSVRGLPSGRLRILCHLGGASVSLLNPVGETKILEAFQVIILPASCEATIRAQASEGTKVLLVEVIP